MMETVKFYACYDFNDEWNLVEMVLDVASSEVDWAEICVPQDDVDRDNWQCAFMEQYLNADGTEKICEVYDEPEEDVQPCRVAFFIFKVGAPTLSTPYGAFSLNDTKPLPRRLQEIIEFDEVD